MEKEKSVFWNNWCEKVKARHLLGWLFQCVQYWLAPTDNNRVIPVLYARCVAIWSMQLWGFMLYVNSLLACVL